MLSTTALNVESGWYTFLFEFSFIDFYSCLDESDPPFGHFGLTALAQHGLIHYWVQLGHDGLALKAGFPADQTVEVYDAWYGLPQNPYKKDTDMVRSEARSADLVLVLGGSLSGSTAEMMISAAERSNTGLPYGGGGALGVIIVNNKKTKYDTISTLKFNCHPDDLVKRIIDRYDILEDVKEEAVQLRIDQETTVMKRGTVLASLYDAVMYEEGDPRIYHGRLFSSVCLSEPKVKEYGQLEDVDSVLDHKLKCYKDIINLSKRTLIYTEAVSTTESPEIHHYGAKKCGISHSEVKEEVPSSYLAMKSFATPGLVHAWVQLGHDGLPQQSGFPYEVREIYDSWRDLEYGSYKEELDTVDSEIGKADLIVILGFGGNLTGKTAELISKISERNYENLGRSLGIIIMSEKHSEMDKFATMKINQSPDITVDRLVTILDLENKSIQDTTQEAIPISFNESSADVADVGASITPDKNIEIEVPNEADGNKSVCHDSSHRARIVDTLVQFKTIQEDDLRIHHGRMVSETCLEVPEEAEGMMEDKDYTIKFKVGKLINLIKLSKKTIICVDAFVSEPELATKVEPPTCILNSLDEVGEKRLALFSHLRLNEMTEFVVQQGHDGVLQKAGFTQKDIIELYDDSGEDTDDKEVIERGIDNADLVVFASESLKPEIFQMIANRLCKNSQSGLKYEDGGALGFVILGSKKTPFDETTTLKINCDLESTIDMLIDQLEIDPNIQDLLSRSCTSEEHRNMFQHVLQHEEETENIVSHGILVSEHSLPEPVEEEEDFVATINDTEEVLNCKVTLLNLLLKSSKRTMIYTEASQGQVLLAGAPYGARCGMSNCDNIPSETHYLLAALHQHGLVQAWAQHGHDGLPQRGGIPVDQVIEVYNSWFDQPENPHNTEIERLKTEIAIADLVIILDRPTEGATKNCIMESIIGHCSSGKSYKNGGRLGVVNIGNATSSESRHSTLNIYANPEDILRRLVGSLNIVDIPSSPKSLCCLHLARALVPYDNKGRRTSESKMWLNLEVGARVKLTSSHDHKLIPAYTTLKHLTEVQKEKLSNPGPKFGSVTKIWPEKCAFEVY